MSQPDYGQPDPQQTPGQPQYGYGQPDPNLYGQQPSFGYQAPADGGPAYDYLPLDARRYQLCAHFLTDTADNRYGRQYPVERAHGAGRHCFTHRVSAAAVAVETTQPALPGNNPSASQ